MNGGSGLNAAKGRGQGKRRGRRLSPRLAHQGFISFREIEQTFLGLLIRSADCQITVAIGTVYEWSRVPACRRLHAGARMAPAGAAGESGSTAEPAPCSLQPFVPLMAEAAPTAKVAVPTPPSAAIEIKLAGAAVRVVSGVDGDLLTAVLRAVRCSSGAA